MNLCHIKWQNFYQPEWKISENFIGRRKKNLPIYNGLLRTGAWIGIQHLSTGRAYWLFSLFFSLLVVVILFYFIFISFSLKMSNHELISAISASKWTYSWGHKYSWNLNFSRVRTSLYIDFLFSLDFFFSCVKDFFFASEIFSVVVFVSFFFSKCHLIRNRNFQTKSAKFDYLFIWPVPNKSDCNKTRQMGKEYLFKASHDLWS